MRKYILITGLAVGVVALANITVPVKNMRTALKANPSIEKVQAVEFKESGSFAKRFAAGNSSLKADFTVAGEDSSLVPTHTFNFDDGLQGWVTDNTSHVEWSTKCIATSGEEKSFSSIDPADKASLFVEGDYRVYNREKSGAVSPIIEIPDNGNLSFYVGYTLNYDDCCRLELSLSHDDFTDENVVLWNSGNETGIKTWYWHPVTIDLSDYAGQEVRFKLLYTWGSADEIFKTGGYLGDFAIDGFQISGRKAIDHIEVMTGDLIHLMDITNGDIVSREWSFPGAQPSTSSEKDPVIYYTTDGNYDVSLTVTDSEGNINTKTISNFVGVTGTSPVARIVPPATFRLTTNRLPLVAPLVPVQFTDGSIGFPDSHSWTFTGAHADAGKLLTSEEENPEVSFAYLHNQTATLTASNSHGSSSDALDFTVEYGGTVSNLLPSDLATTFDMQDWGVFPGSNTRNITAYAERFSKPSRPLMVTGAYVFFNRAEASDLVDQITNVGVHLYSSKDGLPDQRLDSWWWQVFELDTQNSTGETVGTAFPFTEAPFVDEEFFIVVDGIPSYKEASSDEGTTMVSFLMAPFRASGNTALMLKDGVWTEASDYFPAGANHTSFYIYPQVYHSVMAPLSSADGSINVGAEGSDFDYQIFSYLGREEKAEIDCSWLKLLSEPGEYTVDTLKFAVEKLPSDIAERTAHVTLTDGASRLTLTVTQSVVAAADKVAVESVSLSVEEGQLYIKGVTKDELCTIYALSGVRMSEVKVDTDAVFVDISSWPSGVYLVLIGNKTYKFVK